MTYLVPRTCTELSESSSERVSRPVSELRALPAYVLLGDPGAGKSETFKEEAKACGGVYISARDFITLAPPPDACSKTLFIDGLDESRAGEGDGRTPLDRIRGKLDQMGRPAFRLSCRAADWLGASDRHALTRVASAERLSVFHLDRLTREQVRDILANESSVRDPDDFLEQAANRGLAALLENPQTLRLLVDAVRENQWPNTREETFRLACEKLVMESNTEHIAARRSSAPDSAALLNAAGGLCTLQLLADISGFTDTEQTQRGYVALRDIPCLKALRLTEALATRIFIAVGEQRFAYVHRSVAEFLAAKFLADAITANSLPIGRILSLLAAVDGGTVAALRGLHAWLAVHNPPCRQRLIAIDPLGIVLYGDTKRFSVDDKVLVLKALHHLAVQYPAFRWQDWSPRPFGALSTADMTHYFKEVMASPSREEGDQMFLDCVLDAVRYGDPLPELAEPLKAVVLDQTRWPRVRVDALVAYIKLSRSHPDEMRRLADGIRDGSISDPNDELLGCLLHELFPHTITPKEIFDYLHRPKDEHLIGVYYLFWARQLAKSASDADVVILLDELAARKPPRLDETARGGLDDMVGDLLVRGINVHGDSVSDKCLFAWLGMAVDKHGSSRLEEYEAAVIRRWIEACPQRHKGLLSAGIEECAGSKDIRWCLDRAASRLLDAKAPADLWLWWLTVADRETNQDKAEHYFRTALGFFFRGDAASGLSLEFFEEWVAERPRFADAHRRMMYCEIGDWHREHAEAKRKRREEDRKQKHQRIQFYVAHLPAIRAGKAHPSVLHDLAGAYEGRLFGADGDTPPARLSTFLGGDQELVGAALEGFKRSIQRADLPSVAEIFDLDRKGRMHCIRQPCLAGMEELHRDSSELTRELPDDVLAKVVAFHLTNATGTNPEWFKDAALNRPLLVAEVLVQYVGAALKSKREHVVGVYSLAYDDDYTAVARLAVPRLLRNFPGRASQKQVSGALYDLLKAALRCLSIDELTAIVDAKLAGPKLASAQRLYWLATGLAVIPHRYEAALSEFVGKSRKRAQHLAGFFTDRYDEWVLGEEIPVSSVACLVRILAPLCSPARPLGVHWVSPAMRTAKFVNSLIDRLGGKPSVAAKDEITKLLADPSLAAWRSTLHHAQHTQRVSHREATFRHPSVLEVCQTLVNGSPANAADLAALTTDHLRELALEVRHGNTDQYKQFWNVDRHSRLSRPRPEDACRDTLLERLRDRLLRLGIDAQPEGHYADDKRADIRVSYTAPTISMAIPIEIKRDSHRDLWTAISDQLISLYTRAPESAGRGIFVVFWFGGKKMPAPPTGDRPGNAQELKTRLIAGVPEDKRELISVCVIDCSPDMARSASASARSRSGGGRCVEPSP